MPVNTAPRFALNGMNSSSGSTTMAQTFTTAAADYTGATATHNKVVFTADATNGSRLCGLRFRADGTSTNGNVQTVARIFINNGSAATTATNNSFFAEQALPAIGGFASAAAGRASIEIEYYFPCGYIDLEPSFRIVVGLGTTVAGGWIVTPILGGDF